MSHTRYNFIKFKNIIIDNVFYFIEYYFYITMYVLRRYMNIEQNIPLTVIKKIKR